MGASVLAQSPTYGVGRTPTAEEIRGLDISIGPTGEELPAGRGTAKEGAEVYNRRVRRLPWCRGRRGSGSLVEIESRRGCSHLGTGAHTATALAVCDDGVDYINRGMPLGKEGTLTAMRCMR